MESSSTFLTSKEEVDIRTLVGRGDNSFRWAQKMDFRSLEMEAVEEQVYKKGLPIVISNTTRGWQRERELFSFEWLKKNFGHIPIQPRDNATFADLPSWPLSDYLDYISKPASERPRRLYGKDVICPPQWKEYMSNKLSNFWCKGANDLMGEIMKELQAENLLLYIGAENNSTPGHMDILGSIGHNLMVYADEGASALWFCVATEDREKAASFWKKNGGNLYAENHYLSTTELSKAPFTVYVIQQQEGDLVLIPPECVHQVINKNGRSIKVAWNTMNHHTIEISYFRSLPLYRKFGKPEIYRVKAVAYYSLLNRVQAVEEGKVTDTLIEEFPPLLSIVEDIIDVEWIQAEESEEIEVFRFTDDFPHQRTCDFCGCDIWNRCYHCNECGKEGKYDVCLMCVAEGRGCFHKENLVLMEYISLKHIRQEFEKAKECYQKLLRSAKRKRNKKRKIEEWKSKSNLQDSNYLSIATIAHQLVKLYRKHNESEMCHQCEKVQPYSQAVLISCNSTSSSSVCDKKYCARCLWNNYGQKLIECMKSKHWTCPYCKDNCNCTPCLEKKGISPSEYPLDKILESALEDEYPFARGVNLPNVPSVSDYKPHLHMHALKKRKIFSSSSNMNLPSASASSTSSNGTASSSPALPKDFSKMTERQQIRYLMTLGNNNNNNTPSPTDSQSESNSSKSESQPTTPKHSKLRDSSSSVDNNTTASLESSSSSHQQQASSQQQSPLSSASPSSSSSSPSPVAHSSSSATQQHEAQNDSWRSSSSGMHTSYDSWNHRSVAMETKWNGNSNPSETALELNMAMANSGNKNVNPSETALKLNDQLNMNKSNPSETALELNMAMANSGSKSETALELNMAMANSGSKSETALELNMAMSNSGSKSETALELNNQLANTKPSFHIEMDHYSTILVRNLSYSCCREDIVNLFSPFGTIEQITIPMDKTTGKSRGYGFVKFVKREEAEQAITKLNYSLLKDRIIELEWSVDKSSQKKPPENITPKPLICYKCGKDGHLARSCPFYKLDDHDDRDKEFPNSDVKIIHRGYICFKCGKEGHVASECKEKEDSGPGFKGVICFKCGEGGHLANKCDKKTRGCYICGKEGHIAVECSLRYDDKHQLASQQATQGQQSQNLDSNEPSHKYRKLSNESGREPLSSGGWSDPLDRDKFRRKSYESDHRSYHDRYSDRHPSDRNDRHSFDGRHGDVTKYDSKYPDPKYDNRYSDRYNSENRYSHSDRYSHDNRYPSDDRYLDSNRYRNDDYFNDRDKFSRNGPSRDPRYGDRYSHANGNSREPDRMRYDSNRGFEPMDSYRGSSQYPPSSSSSNPSNAGSVQSNAPNPSLPYYGMQSMNSSMPFNSPQQNANALVSLLTASNTSSLQGTSMPQQMNYSQNMSSDKNAALYEDPKRKALKLHASQQVVARLSKYFASGKIASKEQFKQLSRKTVNSLLDKEQRTGYVIDKDTDARIKKYVDHYLQQYLLHLERGPVVVDQWLQSSSTD